MKDSIAGMIAATTAGASQVVSNTDILSDPTSTDTAIGGLISMFVGIVSMLLSRFLNKLASKKKDPKV